MLSWNKYRLLYQFDDILRIVLVGQCHYGRIVNIVSTQLESGEEWCVGITEVTVVSIVSAVTETESAVVTVEIEGDDIRFAY